MKKLILGAAFTMSLFVGTSEVKAESISIGNGTYEFTREVEREIVPGVKYTYFKSTARGAYGTHVWVTEVDLTNPEIKIEYHTADGNMGGKTAQLSAIASNHTSENHKVVAAANANFWVTTETPAKTKLYYYPFGTAVSNGLQFSVNPPRGKNKHVGGPTTTGSIAIGTDGRAYIKRFDYDFNVYNPRLDKQLRLNDCNRLVEAKSASIYNSGYGRSKAFQPVDLSDDGKSWIDAPGTCTEILCDLAPGETAKVGGDVKYVVKEIRTNAGTGTLGNRDLAIVGRDTYATNLAKYEVGDEIVLQQHFNSLDGETTDIIPSMYNATSGNDITMEDGVVLTALINAQVNYNLNNYARTFYGTNDDGTKLWMVVCGNKTGDYTGMTTEQMTYFLKALGATYASQVDCGGSAQMYVNGSFVNSSTEGGNRAVHSGMFVVYTGDIEETTPVITPSSKSYKFGEIKVGASKKKTFTIEGTNLQADIKVSITGDNPEMFSVTPTKVIGANQKGTVTVTYAPTADGDHAAKVHLTSTGAKNVNITISGSGSLAAGANVIYQDDAFAYGVEADTAYTTLREYQDYAIGELEGKSFKRVIARGDIVYILAHDTLSTDKKPTIVVFNHVTKKVVRTLGTDIATVGTPGISDIAITADGTLVGMGYATQVYNSTDKKAQTYKWAKDENGIATGQAEKWFLGNNSGNYNNAYIGEAMVVQGDINTGKIIYIAQTTGSSGDVRMVIGTLNGDKAPTFIHNNQVSKYTKSTLGDILLFPSPFSENNVIIQGTKKECTELGLKGTSAAVPTIVGTVDKNNVAIAACHTGIFRYGGKIYMTTPTFSSSQSNGVRLVDITDGLAAAKTITLSYKALTKKATTHVATVGTTQITMNGDQFVEARLVILAVRDGKVSKFISESKITTPIVDDPSLNSTAPGTVDFEKVMIGASSSKTYTLESMNLKDDVTLTVEGEGFSVDPAVISKETATASYQITFSPTAKANYAGKLTIASTDADPIEIDLVGKGVVEDPNIPQIEGDRGHHAYNLKVTNIESNGSVTGARIGFHLTGDVRNVKLHLYRTEEDEQTEPTAVAEVKAREGVQPDLTVDLGELKAGENAYELVYDGLEKGYYNWGLEVESYIVTSSDKVFHYSPETTNCNGGVTVITDPESAAYGKIVASNGNAQGFMIISPQHEYEGTYCANTPTWTSGNASSTYRISARDNGLVYAVDYSADGAGAWAFDPADPAAGTYNIFSGTKDAAGCWTLADGTVIGGCASGLAFAGSGDDTQLWMFQKALSNVLCRYDIGTDLIVEKAPAKFSGLSGSSLMLNTNVNIFVDEGKGLLLSQTRGAGNNNTSAPSLVYATFDGTVLYNSGNDTDLFANGSAGGVALNADRTILALGTSNGIYLYDVEWDAAGKPSFNFRETTALPSSANARQLVFDNADNLIAYQQSSDKAQSGVNVYAIARDERVVTRTASPALMRIDATVTGVENIEIDENSTTPVFYDIHGVRMVSGDNLVPGMYLKVTGKKIQKVMIK